MFLILISKQTGGRSGTGVLLGGYYITHLRHSVRATMSRSNGGNALRDGREGSQTTGSVTEPVAVLKLRADGDTAVEQNKGKTKKKANVRWESNVIDNEHMNKKKTKICCIYHPQQEFNEDGESATSFDAHECGELCSSSSSSDSSSSESDEDRRNGMDMQERRRRRLERRHRKLQQKRSESPNAYEVQPDYSQQRRQQ